MLHQPSLLDSYEYVMHGRVFKIEHKEGQLIDVLASFGGLLFRLHGEQSLLASIQSDMRWTRLYINFAYYDVEFIS